MQRQESKIFRLVPKSKNHILTMTQVSINKLAVLEIQNGQKYLRIYADDVKEWAINDEPGHIVATEDEKVAHLRLIAGQISIDLYGQRSHQQISVTKDITPIKIIDVINQDRKFIIALEFPSSNAALIVVSESSGEVISKIWNVSPYNLQLRNGAEGYFYYISNGHVEKTLIERGNHSTGYTTIIDHMNHFDVLPNNKNAFIYINQEGICLREYKPDGFTKYLSGRSYDGINQLRKLDYYSNFSVDTYRTQFDGAKVINEEILITWQSHHLYIWRYHHQYGVSLCEIIASKFTFNNHTAFMQPDGSILLSNGMLIQHPYISTNLGNEVRLTDYFELKPVNTPLHCKLKKYQDRKPDKIVKLSCFSSGVFTVDFTGLTIEVFYQFNENSIEKYFFPRIGADHPEKLEDVMVQDRWILVAYRLEDQAIRIEALTENFYRFTSDIVIGKNFKFKEINQDEISYLIDNKLQHRKIKADGMEPITKQVDRYARFFAEEKIGEPLDSAKWCYLM